MMVVFNGKAVSQVPQVISYLPGMYQADWLIGQFTAYSQFLVQLAATSLAAKS